MEVPRSESELMKDVWEEGEKTPETTPDAGVESSLESPESIAKAAQETIKQVESEVSAFNAETSDVQAQVVEKVGNVGGIVEGFSAIEKDAATAVAEAVSEVSSEAEGKIVSKETLDRRAALEAQQMAELAALGWDDKITEKSFEGADALAAALDGLHNTPADQRMPMLQKRIAGLKLSPTAAAGPMGKIQQYFAESPTIAELAKTYQETAAVAVESPVAKPSSESVTAEIAPTPVTEALVEAPKPTVEEAVAVKSPEKVEVANLDELQKQYLNDAVLELVLNNDPARADRLIARGNISEDQFKKNAMEKLVFFIGVESKGNKKADTSKLVERLKLSPDELADAKYIAILNQVGMSIPSDNLDGLADYAKKMNLSGEHLNKLAKSNKRFAETLRSKGLVK